MSNSSTELKRGDDVDQKIPSGIADEKVLDDNLDEKTPHDVVVVAALAEDTVEAAHRCRLYFDPRALLYKGRLTWHLARHRRGISKNQNQVRYVLVAPLVDPRRPP
jgi:hypothetical protein